MHRIVTLLKYFLLMVTVSVLGFFIFDVLSPIDTKAIQDTSRVVKFKDGSWMYATTNSEHKWRFPVDLKKIDPNFIRLLLAYEDQRFYEHYGVDPLAMTRAIGQLIQYKRVVSGGSTITMQLARLLDPKPRTVTSKLIEIVRALQLELHYSKEEILSAYLTLAPYGGNVEGLVAASMRYFGKYPYALSASQIALFVAMPQSPERNRPDRHYKKSIQARDKVLEYAKNEKLIGTYEYQEAIKEELPRKLKPLPRYSPHLAQKLLSRTKDKTLEIETTLNAPLQKQLEHWARSKESILPKGTTFAVLVVKNSDSSIEAYMGSHNMFSKRVSGYVDMIKAIRSPGSTLKPFIYGHGFEEHLVHPNTMIMDKETRFGDYTPHNFSHEYTGEVSLMYALQNSLNIPAVKILNKIGVDSFVEKISKVSGKLHIPKERASLPIALGGVGLSIWQLTQLYVTLANGGSAKSLHYLPKDTNHTMKLFDEDAAKMTTSILRQTPAPEGYINRHHQIAYKTGTSYGYRDAWTMGYTKDYTVAVWVGKPDNGIQLKRTGRNTAAPLAFEVFSLLNSLGKQAYWQWNATYLGNNVPTGLQYFDREEKEKEAKLNFIYPQENERFMSADCSDAMVEIMVENGKEPYYWYIDGEAKNYKRKTLNVPFKHGGHTINVIDSNGATLTRNIWVNKPEC